MSVLVLVLVGFQLLQQVLGHILTFVLLSQLMVMYFLLQQVQGLLLTLQPSFL